MVIYQKYQTIYKIYSLQFCKFSRVAEFDNKKNHRLFSLYVIKIAMIFIFNPLMLYGALNNLSYSIFISTRH